MTDKIPQGFHTLTPVVTFKDSRKAIDFYTRAFGAKETFSMKSDDGKFITHATLIIGNSMMMMCDEFPHNPMPSAQTLKGSPVSFYLYLPDVDAAFKQAVGAGAEAKMPVQDMFWGDRVGSVQDPFGHSWMLATHTKDPSAEDLKKGVAERAKKS